ncbi:Uncharacterised protein [uncultured archaeon]|nr:Uncharacterised protein [uncultured archaeon]
MKRGQLSAEMLILLVLILALVAIVYTQMTKSVNTAGQNLDVKTHDMNKTGTYCVTADECTNGVAGSQLTCDSTNHCAYK